MKFLIGMLMIFVALCVSAEIEGKKGEYTPTIIFGTIISDGVISVSRGAIGPIDPSLMVACDDKILVRVEVSSKTLVAGYKLKKMSE
jgi:hypothetical protein